MVVLLIRNGGDVLMFGAVPASLLMEMASANGKYVQLSLPLNTPPEYDIPTSYFCDIQIGYDYISPNSGTQSGTTQSVNHPGFEHLRTTLERNGHIHTERTWCNGDRVLKPFRLNNKWFDVGEQFPCAIAMGISLA